MRRKGCDVGAQQRAAGSYLPWISIQIPEGGDTEGETAKRKQSKEREGGAEIAELIVRVSTRKPSQHSHSAKC